jgi:hypothetical protein
MEKYHIEKVCPLRTYRNDNSFNAVSNNSFTQDIAQYIKKEVRSLPALPLPASSLITPSSSTLERVPPGTALLAGTLEASLLTVSCEHPVLILSVYTHFAAETKHFIYFYLGHCAILLFKTQ